MKKTNIFGKFALLCPLLLALGGISQAQVSSHALAKTASVPVRIVKFFSTHSLTALKDSAGAVVFAVEDGVVDPLHLGFSAADAATGPNVMGKIGVPVHYFFHGGNVVFSKVDTDFESAESALFGSSN